MIREMLKTSSMDVWSEEMDTAITPVLDIMDEHMNNLELGMRESHNIGFTTLPSDISAP